MIVSSFCVSCLYLLLEDLFAICDLPLAFYVAFSGCLNLMGEFANTLQ